MGEAQIVLGTVWLKLVSPAMCDFEKMKKTVWVGKNAVKLQGISSNTLDIIDYEVLDKMLVSRYNGRWYLLQVISPKEGLDWYVIIDHHEAIKALLEQFKEVFNEPKGLQPK